MRGTGRLVWAVVVATMLAVVIVPIGCGTNDDGDGPTPTPTPTSSGGATPTPTPTPTAGLRIVELVPSIGNTFDAGAADRGFLVAWENDAGPTSTIRGLRVGTDGTPVGESFLISVAQGGGYLENPTWTSPAVGFDGTRYGVVYAGTGTVQGGVSAAAITAVQVGTDGSVGLPADLAETAAVGTCESAVVPPPAIAGSSETRFASLWPLEQGCVGGPVFDRLDGAFAVVQGAGFAVSEINGLLPPLDDDAVTIASAAAVASSGATTVGAWTEVSDGSTTVRVEVALLAIGGAQRVALATAGGGMVRPAIASDGADYLVVWQSAPNTISGARFRPGTGSLDGPSGFVVAQTTGKTLGAPRVAFADDGYLVAWTADPGEAGLGRPDLRVAEVSPQGRVGGPQTLVTGLASAEIALASSSNAFLIPFVVANGASNALHAALYRP
jgi:hypothetical protein